MADCLWWDATAWRSRVGQDLFRDDLWLQQAFCG
jgi:hypothetical protein